VSVPRSRRLRCVLTVAAVFGLLAVTGVTAGPAAASARTAAAGTTTQPCGGTSWVAGSVDVCAGTVVYRDYVYDDEGADNGGIGYGSNTQKAFGTLAAPAGDERYPAGDVNSADLVRLELRRAGDKVQVHAELNALFHPDSTILALAVDTDNNPLTTGGVAGAWPGLGVRSTGWDKIFTFSHGDVRSNTIDGSFPLPSAKSFRVQAVTAQAASGKVMNVAYRGVDEHAAYRLIPNTASPYPYPGEGAWFEDDQAAALKSGDISRFGLTVNADDLRPGVTRAQPVPPGLHERVYTSRYTIKPGEGMTYEGVPGRGTGGTTGAGFEQVFNFLGKYQPYGIWIPGTAGPHGLQMEWHGSNQGIIAQINQPGMQKAFGKGLNRILATPLARGPNGYGSDISERDLLDVMSDVQSHYPVDRRQVFSSGYSQGGYIGFRMAMLFPDRFAGFTTWVGFTGDDLNGTPVEGNVSVAAGAVGNMINYTRNLRHVPGSMIYAGADELVQLPSSSAMQRSFAATDDVYTWYLHPTAEHLTFAILDQWDKEAAYSKNQRLVDNPARVTFRTDPLLDAPSLGIRHDRAYWVSELRGQRPGTLDTDLTSHGCGVDVPVTADGTGAGPEPVPWTSLQRTQTGTRHLPAQQLLEGTLRNVKSLRIDLRGACLSRGATYRVDSDGPTVLALSDGRQVRLHKGVNSGTLAGTASAAPRSQPVSASGPTGGTLASTDTSARRLAATGAPAGTAVLGLALAALAALVLLPRRRAGRG